MFVALLLLACGGEELVEPEPTTMGIELLAPAEGVSLETAEAGGAGNGQDWILTVTYRAYDAGNDNLGNGYTYLCTDAASCGETFTLSQSPGTVDLGTAGTLAVDQYVESSSGAAGYWDLKASRNNCASNEKQITIVWMAQQDGPTGPDGIAGEYAQDYFNSYFQACLQLQDGASFTASPTGGPCNGCGWDEPWWSINSVPEYDWLYSPGYSGSWAGTISRAP